MNRRTKGMLIVSGLLVAVTVTVLTMAISTAVAKQHCKDGFPTLISCTFTW